MNLVEVEERIEVPKGAGVEGFLHTLREILKLPRVQSVHIDANGIVTYRRLALPDEPAKLLALDFGKFTPYTIIRARRIVEPLIEMSPPSLVSLVELLRAAAKDRLWAVAIVTGPNSRFKQWLKEATKSATDEEFSETVFGVPILTDGAVDNDMVLLCAAASRSADLADTHTTYKVVLPPSQETHDE